MDDVCQAQYRADPEPRPNLESYNIAEQNARESRQSTCDCPLERNQVDAAGCERGRDDESEETDHSV